MIDGNGDQRAVAAPLQPGAQIIFAHVVGADVTPEDAVNAPVVPASVIGTGCVQGGWPVAPGRVT